MAAQLARWSASPLLLLRIPFETLGMPRACGASSLDLLGQENTNHALPGPTKSKKRQQIFLEASKKKNSEETQVPLIKLINMKVSCNNWHRITTCIAKRACNTYVGCVPEGSRKLRLKQRAIATDFDLTIENTKQKERLDCINYFRRCEYKLQ